MARVVRWTAVLALSVLVAACGQPDNATLKQNARQALEAGRYKDAVVALKNVLKESPDDGEARYLLGVTALDAGDPAGAEAQLKRAADLGIAAEKVQPPLAKAMLRQGEYEALLSRVDPDAVKETAHKVDILVARGRASLALDDAAAAASALGRAHALNADSPAVIVGLARLALDRGDMEQAKQLAGRARDLAPEDPDVRLLEADLAMRGQRFAGAEKGYAQLVADNPVNLTHADRFRVRAALIEALVRQNKLDRAQVEADKLVKAAPQQPFGNFLSAYVAYHQERYAEAVERLQVVLSAQPDNPRALSLMGAVKARQGQLAQAKMYLNDAISAEPGDVQSRVLLASVTEKMGQKSEAGRIISEGVEKAGGDDRTLQILGGAALQGGYLQDVLGQLQRDENGSQAARMQAALGQAVLNNGQAKGALAVLKDALGEAKDGDQHPLAVAAALSAGNLDKALTEAQNYVKDAPKSAVAHNLLGAVQMAREAYPAARASFHKALELAPAKAGDIQRYLGLLALAEKQPDQAKAAFAKALDASPHSVDAMLGMARAEQALGDTEAGVEWLQRIRKADPDAWRPRLVLGFYELQRGNAEEARTIAREAARAAGSNVRVQMLLGLSSLSAGDAEQAVKDLTQAVNAHPGNARLRYLLGRAQIQASEPQAALKTAQSLRSQRNGEGFAEMLAGLVHLKAGEYQAAAESLGKAAAQGHREALVAAVAARRRAGLENPLAPMEHWLSVHPDDNGVRVQLAQWYASSGETQKAIRQYEALLDKGGEQSAGVLNNLAWLYFQDGDPRAQDMAARALKLAPNNGPVLDTAGWIAFKGGDKARATSLLAKAVKRAPEARDIRYHYAAVLADKGDIPAAREQLKAILGDQRQFATRAEAEKLYADLSEAKTNDSGS